LSYSEKFKDHLTNPRHVGGLADANCIAELTNPICGDQLRLALRVCKGRIEAVHFLAYGCAPTIACGSALAEMIEGITVEEAAQLSRQDIARALDGLPVRKTHAAALAIETLQLALSQTECDQ
jgi:nitrogen fixation NifU-like protein